ncbi:hypothetical protein HKBW3C_02560, partial [Candidatus Hakubella thermalkaliphila]
LEGQKIWVNSKVFLLDKNRGGVYN